MGKDLTIAQSGTTSGAFNFGGFTKLAIQFPAAMTGATVSFVASNKEDGTYVAVHESGTPGAVSVAATPSTVMGVVGDEAAALAPCKWLKIVSASAEAAARSLIVYME
jgi:hypothetical protein